MVAALYMPPVEVGAPSSMMELGSVWSETDPFSENIDLFPWSIVIFNPNA